MLLFWQVASFCYDWQMRKPFVPFLVVGLLAVGHPAGSEDTPTSDVVWKIRREAVDRSQILSTLHVLTDVYGPRLTGSPNLKRRASGRSSR